MVLQKNSLTRAEAEIVDNFLDLGNRSKKIADPEEAMAVFTKNGLPSRRLESWHYTDLRTQLVSIAPHSNKADGMSVAPLIPGNIILATVNGKTVFSSSSPLLLNSLFFTPLCSLSESTEKIDLLQQKLSIDNVIAQLNRAFVHDGWKINIFKNVSFGKIIEIQNVQNGAQSHVFFPVTVGKNANVVVIERQIGDDQESFLSSISNLDIAEEAQVMWIIIRKRGISSTELNQLNARLSKNAYLKLYIINVGLRLLRQEINIDLSGDGANFQLRCINLLMGKSHIDTTMVVRHLAKATTSKEIVRNVVTDSAHGIFQGAIRIDRTAQKVDARMVCNTLILSDHAEFNAKPELEIFADDVSCSHGATVTEIDHNHLFYLMARGIPESRARAILIKAFVSELINEPERIEIEDVLQSVLGQWLQTCI